MVWQTGCRSLPELEAALLSWTTLWSRACQRLVLPAAPQRNAKSLLQGLLVMPCTDRRCFSGCSRQGLNNVQKLAKLVIPTASTLAATDLQKAGAHVSCGERPLKDGYTAQNDCSCVPLLAITYGQAIQKESQRLLKPRNLHMIACLGPRWWALAGLLTRAAAEQLSSFPQSRKPRGATEACY